MKKQLLILFFGLVVSFFVVYTAGKVYADDLDRHPLIIEKLVERFGLDKKEVRKVFDEEREERRRQKEALFEERLSQAVREGKISEEQKKAILAKKKEIEANREESKNLSWEERREKMEACREEMKVWAKEKGIDLTFLPMLLGRGGRGFGGLGFGK